MTQENRVNLDDYRGPQQPALKPENLGGLQAAVLTISAARPQVQIPNGDGTYRTACVLEFAEFPGYVYYANIMSVRAVVAKLGDLADQWVGQPIPLEIVAAQNPKTGERQHSLWVAEPDTWDEHLHGMKTIKAGRMARNAAAPAAPKLRASKKAGTAPKLAPKAAKSAKGAKAKKSAKNGGRR